MKIQLARLLPLVLLLPFSLSLAAPIPAAPDIGARGFILQDAHSGRILVETNADERLEPASLTKIMTAYIAFTELGAGNIKLEDQVTVSKKAWRTQGSRMFIEVNTQVQVEQLLHGIITQSGNDASVALAEHIAGSEEAFAQLMNSHALRMGMTNTNFINSTGLPDPEHYTTARDMAVLTKALIREYPDYYKWFSIHEYTYNDITQYNRNKLLWRDKTVDGVKTGYTVSAGYCLIGSALRGDMRLIGVVMGTKGPEARAKAMQTLLNYGFRYYETHKLYAANEQLTRARVWKGAQEHVALGLSEDLYLTIPRNEYDNLKASMTVSPQIMAPVGRGEPYGRIQVDLAGEEIVNVPLVALGNIGEGDIWQQMMDEVRLWFE